MTGIIRTGNGSPVQGVRVSVTPVPEPGEPLRGILSSIGETGTDGRYRLDAVLPGAYYVMAGPIDRPLYHPGVDEPANATVVVVAAGVTAEISEMTFMRAGVTGRVTDSATGAGRPIETLALCCNYPRYGVVNLIHTSVNPDGTFEFPDVLPGVYYIAADDPTIVPIGHPIRVGVDGLAGVEVKVSAGTAIQGVVIDGNGTPVTGGALRLRPSVSAAAFDVTEGSASLGVLNFISHLFLQNFGPPSSILAEPFMPEMVESLMDRSAGILRHAQIQADGSFSFTDILPGAYRLERVRGCTLAVENLETGLEGLDGVRIESQDLQFHGRVVLDDGGPLPPLLRGSIRFFVPSSPDVPAFPASPDAEGRFPLCLAPGEYRVFAEYPGYRVLSISDGSTNLLRNRFLFDDGPLPEIVVTIGR